MSEIKQAINYWCEDTVSQKHLGQGVGIAVLDTGIMLHPDFGNRISAFCDIVNEQRIIYDDNGHGTHVSGLLVGSGRVSQGLYAGIAPKGHLAMVKVLNQKGSGKIAHVLAGLQWVIENRDRYGIRIVNVSVGTIPKIGDKEEEKLIEGVEAAWDYGLVVITAAGNYGPESGTITTPGISRKVITVGSSDGGMCMGHSGLLKKDYSGRGPTMECVCKPDVVAPGSHMISCNANYRQKNTPPYISKSGTSMSTPVVSGAIALLLSKYPDLSNVEVKLRLRESCRDLGEPANRQGWGMLDVAKLMR
ncbi:MAG: S8 family peptidase [Lachnospiraceae bacterium]